MLERYALSTEADDAWKKWKAKIWLQIFEHLKPRRVRSPRIIFSERIEYKWYKFRVNVVRKIHSQYNFNRVITKQDKKILLILRDYQYEMSILESKLLKIVYGFQMA